jgi:hypothetical protein
MIPRPQGLCPMCKDGKKKTLINGVCTIHYWASKRQPLYKKKGSGIIVQDQDAISSPPPSELYQWYLDKIPCLAGKCMECGARIDKWIHLVAMSAIAHILPKDDFESIQCHDLAWLELGPSCGCHSRYDKSWHSASKMKVWPLVLERVQVLSPLIQPQERKKIPAILLPYMPA